MSIEPAMAGGRGRGGRGVPFGNAEAKKELRRPMAAPLHQVNQLADKVSGLAVRQDDSAFNVNATEFVPKSSLSISASEFVPTYAQEEDSSQMQEPSTAALYDAMEQLTYEPGRFDSIAKNLTESLNKLVKDYETLENLSEVILEKGIVETNFRYTGARLCDHLSQHMTVIIEGATLRQILMQKCNREFKRRREMLQENSDRLRGFTLFLAELFQQLEIQVGDVRQRVQVLGEAVPQLVSTLCCAPHKDNVRCVVQTLKCCGSVLEEEERMKPSSCGGTPICDNMFKELDELCRREDLEAGIRDMLSSLLRLREAGWGHSPPGTAQPTAELPGVGSYQLDPVFYAPDGQTLTMEEYNFLQEYGVGDEDVNSDIPWSTGDDNPDMGDEIEAAYEEFLQMQSK